MRAISSSPRRAHPLPQRRAGSRRPCSLWLRALLRPAAPWEPPSSSPPTPARPMAARLLQPRPAVGSPPPASWPCPCSSPCRASTVSSALPITVGPASPPSRLQAPAASVPYVEVLAHPRALASIRLHHGSSNRGETPSAPVRSLCFALAAGEKSPYLGDEEMKGVMPVHRSLGVQSKASTGSRHRSCGI